MTIHDHFNGSSHCQECGGKCTLTDDDEKITRLVRYIFTTLAFQKTAPNMLLREALTDMGVDVAEYWTRANGDTLKQQAADFAKRYEAKRQ